MNNYISIVIQCARDGGLSIHETLDGASGQEHVFSGDSKQIAEYVAKRVNDLVNPAKVSSSADDIRKHTEELRQASRGRSITPRVLADSLIEHEDVA